MTIIVTGTATHDANLLPYEQTRQAAEVGATQAQLKTAYLAYSSPLPRAYAPIH